MRKLELLGLISGGLVGCPIVTLLALRAAIKKHATMPPGRPIALMAPRQSSESSQLKTRSMIRSLRHNSASSSCSLAPKRRQIDARATYVRPTKCCRICPRISLLCSIPCPLLVALSNLMPEALFNSSRNPAGQSRVVPGRKSMHDYCWRNWSRFLPRPAICRI
jgi:hypothetical protein